jgi:hypothetical protein
VGKEEEKKRQRVKDYFQKAKKERREEGETKNKNNLGKKFVIFVISYSSILYKNTFHRTLSIKRRRRKRKKMKSKNLTDVTADNSEQSNK